MNRSANTPPTRTNPAKHAIHAPSAKLTAEAPCPVSRSPAASATGTMPSPKRETVRATKKYRKFLFQRPVSASATAVSGWSRISPVGCF